MKLSFLFIFISTVLNAQMPSDKKMAYVKASQKIGQGYKYFTSLFGFQLGISKADFLSAKVCDGKFKDEIYFCDNFKVKDESYIGKFRFTDDRVTFMKLTSAESKISDFLSSSNITLEAIKNESDIRYSKYKNSIEFFNDLGLRSSVQEKKEVWNSEQQDLTVLKKSLKGDKLKIYNSCSDIRNHLPKESSLADASEWHIIPLYSNSKTYGERPVSGGGAHLVHAEMLDGKGNVVDDLTSCDYVRVVFKGSKISKIDRTKCTSVSLESSLDAPCRNLLGY